MYSEDLRIIVLRALSGRFINHSQGEELYPTLEDKAAMLLYLVVKNHSFVDGNKRIAAALFLYFLDKKRSSFQGGWDTPHQR